MVRFAALQMLEVLSWFEEMVRFLLLAQHELSGHVELAGPSAGGLNAQLNAEIRFDSFLNSQQLDKVSSEFRCSVI